MDEASRMGRAKAWGGGADVVGREQASKYKFQTGKPVVVEGLHGTRGRDIKEFDLDEAGSNFSQDEGTLHFSDSADDANAYATSDTTGMPATDGAVYPVYIRMRNPLVADSEFFKREGMGDIFKNEDRISAWDAYHPFLKERAEELGADGIILKDSFGRSHYISFDPKNIRGKFAKFDPAEAGSSKLLAGLPAGTPDATLAVGGGAYGAANPVDWDGDGAITATGRAMCEAGLHPRLAHLLVRARGTPHEAMAADLAALLSERDLLRSRDPDMRTRLEALRGHAHGADPGALARVRDLARQLRRGESGRQGDVRSTSVDNDAGMLLAWAYPDRIAQARGSGFRYLLSNGRGALLEQASTLSGAEYLVALDLDDAEGAEARIRLAAPLTLTQLEAALPGQVRESVETYTDPRGALQARRATRLGALLLVEQRVALDPAQVAGALLEQVRGGGLATLPWRDADRVLLARLRFVAAHAPASQDWPSWEDEALIAQIDTWLMPWLQDIPTLARLGDGRLGDALLSRLDRRQRQLLDEYAPTHVTVPTGSRIAVDYLDDSAPCIEVRMQEVFGLADTPRLAGGRVPVTLKLLSPARRPMQITRDLAGFWRGSYADVRKDMRGRYPRHYWPENPLEAEPMRGAKPRR